MLISIVITLLYYIYFMGKVKLLSKSRPLFGIPIVVAVLSTPLFGWLADAKFGNYRVFKFGVVLIFLSLVTISSLLVLEALFWDSKQIIDLIILCLFSSLLIVGTCAFYATALPLGLDQMPDASSSSIASYITWFVGVFFIGPLLGEVFNHIKISEETTQSYQLILALLPAIGISVVLSSIFLFSPKWLIVEPKSPQTMKIIYEVLKFAP